MFGAEGGVTLGKTMMCMFLPCVAGTFCCDICDVV